MPDTLGSPRAAALIIAGHVAESSEVEPRDVIGLCNDIATQSTLGNNLTKKVIRYRSRKDFLEAHIDYNYIILIIDGHFDRDVQSLSESLSRARRNGIIKDACICMSNEAYEQGRSSIITYNMRFYHYRGINDLEQVTSKLLEIWSSASGPNLAVPPQLDQAYQFGGPESEAIDLIDSPGEGLTDSAGQREGYHEIRIKAEALIADTANSNRLRGLADLTSRLLESMNSSASQIKVRSFWSQMNGLRRRLEADALIKVQDDPECPPLPIQAAYQLRDLVDALNVYAAHEPKLSELDELRTDPAERVVASNAIGAADKFVQEATSDKAVTSAAVSDSLAESSMQASGSTGPSSNRAKQFFVRSARNLALEMIRRAYDFVRDESNIAIKGARDGMYRMVGAVGGAYVIAQTIARNEHSIRILVDTLGASPLLNHIIDLIIGSIK